MLETHTNLFQTFCMKISMRYTFTEPELTLVKAPEIETSIGFQID